MPKTTQKRTSPEPNFRLSRAESGHGNTVRDSRNRVVRGIDCCVLEGSLASTGWRQTLLEPRDTLPRESPAQEKRFVSSASVIARYPSHARVAVVARVEASTRRLAKASRFFSSGVAKFSRSRTSTRKSGRTGELSQIAEAPCPATSPWTPTSFPRGCSPPSDPPGATRTTRTTRYAWTKHTLFFPPRVFFRDAILSR